MTVSELATAMNVSETTVHDWETSELELPDVVVKKVVGILDVSIAYLLGDSDNPDHKPLPAKGNIPETPLPDRRKNRLWLRDMSRDISAGGNDPKNVLSCLRVCGELLGALQNEGMRMTRNELAALLRELEKLRSIAEELMRKKA